MSQAPAMPLWTDALIGDTTHLSAEEFGAYMLILIATWRNNGQPLPDDDSRLARICRATEARWVKKLRTILVSFFDLSCGTWRQKRLEKEWNFVAEKIAKNREKGKLSGEARRLKNKNSGPTDVPPRFEPDDEPNANTHTHTQKEEDSSSKVVNLPARYAFEGKVIKLNQKDFDGWRTTYHGVPDIAACLTPLDDSMAVEDPPPKGKEWFFRASTWLSKRHEKIMEERATAKALADRPLEERYPNDGVYRSSGKPNGADAYTGPVGPPVASTA